MPRRGINPMRRDSSQGIRDAEFVFSLPFLGQRALVAIPPSFGNELGQANAMHDMAHCAPCHETLRWST